MEKRKAKSGMRVTRFALLVCVAAGLYSFFLSSSSLRAQDPPAQRPFTTEVNYVRVDMYPTSGAKGSAVLEPGTFTAQIVIPSLALEAGDYKLLIRAKGVAARLESCHTDDARLKSRPTDRPQP